MTFLSAKKLGLINKSRKKQDVRGNSDEIYSPETESVILSPDLLGNSVIQPYENTSAEEDEIEEQVYCYGRIISTISAYFACCFCNVYRHEFESG